MKIEGIYASPTFGGDTHMRYGAVEGKVIDVLLPESRDDVTVPSLVMGVTDSEGNKDVVRIVELDTIRSLKY